MKIGKAMVKVQEIADKVESYPYDVWTVFFSRACKPEVFGSQISMGPDTDYKDIEEVKAALVYLVEQFDGEVKWN